MLSSSERASIAASPWRAFPLLADIQVPQGLCPPKYTTEQGRPPQARRHQVEAKKKKKKKIFSLLRAPEARPPPSTLPAGWRGPFPARDQQRPQQRRQEAKPLLMLFRGAPVRPPPAARLFRAPGPPPLRACAVPHEGAGLRFLSAAPAVAAAVSVR